MTLAEFNAATSVDELLSACLDVPTWVAVIALGRPYAEVEDLQSAADRADQTITWEQVAAALNRHPRIGQKSAGATSEAQWSASEQAGVTPDEVDEFAAANMQYEEKFGHIFLICASGLSGEQMLACLRTRMGNTAADERPVVIGELKQIGRLRLAKAVQP